MRSAMGAASQLPGGEPTDVDNAPAPACLSKCCCADDDLLHLNLLCKPNL